MSEPKERIRPEDLGIGLLFNAIRDAVVVGDLESETIVAWNDAAEQIFGYTKPEAIGASLDLLTPDDMKASHKAGLERVRRSWERVILDSGRPVALEAIAKDGTTVDIEMTLGSLGDGYALAIIRDITERATAEKQLARMVNELRRLDALKTRLIADAAHELRQPLATLSGYAHLLATRRDTMTPEQQERAFDALERQSDHINTLIGNLLDLSQIDREHLTMAITTVPVAAAVERALEVAPPPPGKQVTVTISPGTTVRADGSRLDQVLINLITNAYRYGGDAIDIGASTTASTTTVTVADNGEGIPEPFVANMFEPFARGSNTATVRGSGLGLAIVKKIITAFEGDIRYETNEPHGARFVLTLPPG